MQHIYEVLTRFFSIKALWILGCETLPVIDTGSFKLGRMDRIWPALC